MELERQGMENFQVRQTIKEEKAVADTESLFCKDEEVSGERVQKGPAPSIDRNGTRMR